VSVLRETLVLLRQGKFVARVERSFQVAGVRSQEKPALLPVLVLLRPETQPLTPEYNDPVSESLQNVLDHLRLYEHPLLAFSARESNGVVEVLIDLKNSSVPVHTYVLPIHARDLDHPQFAWHLQRQLYDGLHDYFIEMFIRTPQDRPSQSPAPAADGSHES
jgi:hypothetical protein